MRIPMQFLYLIIHDQSKDIEKEIRHLEEHLRYIGCENQCIHAGPIIRGEHQYKYYELEMRRNLLKDMMYFIRHVDINVDSVYFEKRKVGDNIEATGTLAKKLSKYIREHFDYFSSYDAIKIYYDKGQIELNVIL